jgi:hypothetical protein
MTAPVLLFVLLVVADVALWIAAATAPLSSVGRFRAAACAVMLLVVLCGVLLGWPRTAVLSGIALWLAAIVAGMLPGTATRAA